MRISGPVRRLDTHQNHWFLTSGTVVELICYAAYRDAKGVHTSALSALSKIAHFKNNP
jgi:hypothetical protein